jgi:hypothetical protein
MVRTTSEGVSNVEAVVSRKKPPISRAAMRERVLFPEPGDP